MSYSLISSPHPLQGKEVMTQYLGQEGIWTSQLDHSSVKVIAVQNLEGPIIMQAYACYATLFVCTGGAKHSALVFIHQ